MEAIDYFVRKEFSIAQEYREFDGENSGSIETARAMQKKLNELREKSRRDDGFLYDQLAADLANWIQEH